MTDWLTLARDSFSASTSFLDANYRKQVEDNINMFNSQHPAGSKYLTDGYKHRSRLFRPKSRSVVRKNEAAAATAYFANIDVVNLEAQNEADPAQLASADINKELLQYRLTKTIPWFQTLIGAFQEAQVVGMVCSYQDWEYREKVTRRKVVGLDEFGEEVEQTIEDKKVLVDKPDIKLVPFENIRFDASADWRDIVNTTPYFIEMLPMYMADVTAAMNTVDPKTGQPKFKKISDEDIRVAVNSQADTTRQTREEKMEDSKQSQKPIKEFEIIWVHRNIIRVDEQDWVYYTLGTHQMLTEPKKLEEVYFTGDRPYVIGVSVIEAHKAMPDSIVGLGTSLQKEANEIVNQRLDNVKLVLNKRWIVKRGEEVDTKSLLRNVAGSVTLANNVESDIREVNFPDVTGSAYAEQDRVNVDYDELVGNFSSGSVQSNRSLNETVGGLGLIASGANQMTAYLLQTFNETWVEPVLRQMVKLEQKYETDQVILAIAAEKAQVYQKYGVDQITDQLLDQELTLSINLGDTDPNARLQKFLLGMQSLTQISQAPPPGANMEEITKEIFSQLGYKDGKRFFKEDVDPMIEQLQGQIQQLTAIIESKQVEQQAKTQDTQMNIESDQVLKDKELQFKYDEMANDKQLEIVKLING
jgi:hypothetical protein